jgi:hypothetical protein
LQRDAAAIRGFFFAARLMARREAAAHGLNLE